LAGIGGRGDDSFGGTAVLSTVRREILTPRY
jgi:hypothetical protein